LTAPHQDRRHSARAHPGGIGARTKGACDGRTQPPNRLANEDRGQGDDAMNTNTRHPPRARAAARTSPRSATKPVDRPPLQVRLFSPILKAMVRAGIPLGYNGLMTVPGRKSGEPRTVAVAIIPIDGRTWVWAPWGDVHWVQNLRAAGSATIRVRKRDEHVTATELNHAQRIAFFTDTLGAFARRIPFGVAFIRLVDGIDLNRPQEAADRSRVFELHRPA
jgi:deazaflavin-dependent oxidoreductase (nitroreductase family)